MGGIVNFLMNGIMNFLSGNFSFLMLVIVLVVVPIAIVKLKENNQDQSVNTDSTMGVKHNAINKTGVRMKENKIVRVALSGGILGAIFTNPRQELESVIAKYNADGWNCHQIIPHSTRNLVISILQIVILICLLGLWTFHSGYLVLLERETGGTTPMNPIGQHDTTA